MQLSRHRTKTPSHEALMRYARLLGFGDLHYRRDPASGLNAIIAVHNTVRGPAIGGCRFYAYQNETLALKDVLRLSSMMTLKNAACGLPHGGAKAVILKPQTPHKAHDRQRLFHAFGDFVNELNGNYITAMDVGTTNNDMDWIAERTPYVIGASRSDPLQQDPSPFTAKSVLRGMQAAVKFALNCDSLEGISVNIQGVGKVGAELARLLFSEGADIRLSDIDAKPCEALREQFPVKILSADAIIHTPCDVFSPCALGGILNHNNVERLNCRIIAGSANNQLAHHRITKRLDERGILYVPDFMINAGGVIQAASVYDYHDLAIANQKIDELSARLFELFERAAKTKTPTNDVAYQIAYENLRAPQLN